MSCIFENLVRFWSFLFCCKINNLDDDNDDDDDIIAETCLINQLTVYDDRNTHQFRSVSDDEFTSDNLIQLKKRKS